MIASLLLSKPCGALRTRLSTALPAARSASHWANIKLAPPDKILGLNEAFKADTRTNKVNLGVGAYRDDKGKPFVLPSVQRAIDDLEKMKLDHEYSSIAGVQTFIDKSVEFAYGKGSRVLADGRVAAVQALSGTGACRITGEFVATFFGRGKKMYISNPTVLLVFMFYERS
jgi:aspartate aminotransferase